MIAGMLVVGTAAMWGVNQIHQDFGVTVRGFRELRSVYEIGFHISTAQSSLRAQPPNRAEALASVRMAIAVLSGGDAGSQSTPLPLSLWLDENRSAGQALLADLQESEIILAGEPRSADVNLPLDRSMQQLGNLSNAIGATIGQREQAVASERRFALLTDAVIALLITAAALWIGRRQYLAVMNPLDRLADVARRIAGGDLARRLDLSGDAEFAALAKVFNRMAGELQELYHGLEEKIAAASKELVRTERLASVGYLAAGVAHEINNPLGIISGYAERSLELIGRGLDENNSTKVAGAIRVICEQAFRCKEITDRLLMLARPSAMGRCSVSLRGIAEEVLANIAGLPRYADRKFQLQSDPQQELTITANPGELKQVVLNLLLNAVDATQPGSGQIFISLQKHEHVVELSVSDNGRGMTPQTLQRVFEPFFTDKRSEPGTGLGLSITHAIVQDHGGRITTESAGLGLGSRFTVILPIETEGGALADVRN
jgi:two-component system, NtrC family, sensor kinase